MPIAKFQMPDGRIARFEVAEGTTPEQAQIQIQQMVESGQLEQPATPQEQPASPRPETMEAQQPEEDNIEALRQKIIENPAGATVAEFGSAVNRGAVNLLDFFGPKAINSALELAGVDARIPEIAETEIGKAATTGQFMEPGLAREAVRTAGEYVAPGAVAGQTARTLAKTVPLARTTGERVIQQLGSTRAAQDVTGAALAGGGREVGGAVGEEVGGETGRQVGEFAGSLLFPIGGALVKESGKSLVTKGAKKLLEESAPTIQGLKTAARSVYNELDRLGVNINPSAVTRLSNQLNSVVKKEGFNETIHPKVNAALKEFQKVKDTPQSLSQVDTLRRVAKAAADSNEPSEKRLGSLMLNRIDDFLDSAGKNELTKTGKDVGGKYRDARQLWRRAKKGEQLEEAFKKAELQATGFENGIRNQFRSILNSKNKSKGFTKEEIEAMRGLVKGSTVQNMAKMLGRFGLSEGQASNMLMGYGGIIGGAAAGGPVGAVAVPAIGQVSKKLAQKLTREGAKGADIIVRAGNNGIDVVKAYMKAVPAKQRTPQELTELLLRPDISLEGLKVAARSAPKNQKSLINDAAFLVNAIKSAQEEEQ